MCYNIYIYMKSLYTIEEASNMLGVSKETLRRWERKGKITSERTQGKHRRYKKETIDRLLNKEIIRERMTGVSTNEQKEDLKRQIQLIENYCSSHGYKFDIISDIGSGLNYNKKGIKQLIELIESDSIDRLVISYKDRLLRFGSEILFQMCDYHNVEVVIINSMDNTFENELVDDVLSIITVYSAKLYGKRSHKNKKIIEENKKLFRKED